MGRGKSLSRSAPVDGYELVELDRHEVGQMYTIVTYAVGDGEYEDPATTVHHHVATFAWGTEPVELTDDGKDRRHRWGWDGFKDALHDEAVAVAKEGDGAADEHRRDTELLEAQAEEAESASGHYLTGYKKSAANYMQFMDAVDKIGRVGDDEKAWAVIDSYRRRSLREDEG